MNEPVIPSSRETISLWIRERIAEYVRAPLDAVNPTEALTAYGLDSVYALTLSEEIERRFGVVIPATLLWDSPSIADLIEHVAAGNESLP